MKTRKYTQLKFSCNLGAIKINLVVAVVFFEKTRRWMIVTTHSPIQPLLSKPAKKINLKIRKKRLKTQGIYTKSSVNFYTFTIYVINSRNQWWLRGILVFPNRFFWVNFFFFLILCPLSRKFSLFLSRLGCIIHFCNQVHWEDNITTHYLIQVFDFGTA